MVSEKIGVKVRPSTPKFGVGMRVGPPIFFFLRSDRRAVRARRYNHVGMFSGAAQFAKYRNHFFMHNAIRAKAQILKSGVKTKLLHTLRVRSRWWALARSPRGCRPPKLEDNSILSAFRPCAESLQSRPKYSKAGQSTEDVAPYANI